MEEVVRPVGKATAKAGHLAPRLDTLDGKTLCEAWNCMFKGERTFPRIRELLQKRYPKLKVIPYTEFPTLDAVGIDDKLKGLAEILLKKGCDALISGNGG